ncbi:hypothetical protein [Hymenobacter terricola]|uniref:hypothetical protein n=1 Tax=Hymenobacter terricola TaxID=2819236 RepID=UPI001B3156CB|nr:hypothetical protein [Hymenobacter terricola]
MNYRESYARKTAVQMYYQGDDRAAVMKMLQNEGASERADSLADEYYENFLFIQSHHKKRRQKGAGGLITIGLVFIAGSVAYALMTFIALDTVMKSKESGNYFYLWAS